MLFYSVVLGAVGPVLAYTVPPIREHFGYRPPEPIPITYPRASFLSLLPPVARSFCRDLRFQALTFYTLLTLGLDSSKATETAGTGL